MAFSPKTIVLDGPTGYWEIAIREALGDTAKSNWGGGIPWGAIGGQWNRDIHVAMQINAKYGTIIGVAAHLAQRNLRDRVGTDNKGMPIYQDRMIGWQVAIPGKGASKVIVPFDEVYLIEVLANEVGSNPMRRLVTSPYMLYGYKIDTKSRKGVKGPITNATYDLVCKAVSPGKDTPTTFMVIGEPGVGKTTFFGTCPGPRLFIDMQGGCEEEAKKPETRVMKPTKLEEVYNVLRTIRDKGELP